ncbi:hypothetical protein BSL78_29909 [Apostichopus japonicus]|uniref:Uncharacterized protein n=1 Tax=Stichopus japonicus TaxID=307972 RepID=A0A2G8JC40_STIJA|nr:hypothetical protein BSL78_29909 [Apostichopus japonicus]
MKLDTLLSLAGPEISIAVSFVHCAVGFDRSYLCEEGWVPGYDFRCYKFGSEMLSWEDARLDCQSIPDGDLVSLRQRQNGSLSVPWVLELHGGLILLQAGTREEAIIGLSKPQADRSLFDRASEGEYRWVTCDALDTWATDNWAPGQPNDLQGNQDCVQMLGSGMWNDLECTSESLYVCEVTVKDYTVDDQSPDTLRGEATDPSTVELTWEPSAYNCEVLGYTIYIQEGINSMTQTVEGGDTTSTLVKNLEPSTVYVFDIAAFTTYDTLPAVGRTVRITMPSASSGECGPSSYTSASGVIISPNYPKPYSNNLGCSYMISLPDSSKVVQLFMNDFHLEDGHDFLTVGIGSDIFENTAYTLTGSEVPSEITTGSSMVWLYFSSDESVTDVGFSISFESLTVETTGAAVGSVMVLVVDETESSGQVNYSRSGQVFQCQIVCQLFQVSWSSVPGHMCSRSVQVSLCRSGQAKCSRSENVVIVDVVEVSEGVEVTFWMSDPTDPTGATAALTSEVKAFDQPWVIATTTVVGFCVLLIVLVLIRNCFCPRTKGSSRTSSNSDDVEMVRNDQDMESLGAYNNNALEIEDDIKRVPVDDDPSTLYTIPTKNSEKTTKAQIESSHEGSTSSVLEDSNEPGSSSSSFKAEEK